MGQIQLFVELQKGLWEKLRESIGEDIDELLFNIPKNGEVDLSGDIWVYSKHGLGVCFTNLKTKRKVDLHKADSGAECFDVYGLSTYFGSLGNKGQKILNKYGMESESYLERIGMLVDKLEKSGDIDKKGEAYELIWLS